MYKKKNVIIGLIGLVLTILLVVVIMNSQAFAKQFQTIGLLLGLSLAVFFVGFSMGGLYLGVPVGLYMGALCGIMAAPAITRGPLALVLLASLFLGPKLLALLGKKLAHHVTKGQEAQEELKEVLKNAIYLIKPCKWKGHIIYKVVDKGGYLYFCRCGGQFYGIHLDIAKNTNPTQEELLIDKESFRVKKEEIKRVEINAKSRCRMGILLLAEEELGFLIHGIQDCLQVQAFFNAALNCPVSVLSGPGAEQVADLDLKYKNQNSRTRERMKKTTGFLNGLGWVSALWLLLFPFPMRWAVGVGLIVPIVGILYYLSHGPLVTFDLHRGQARPHISSVGMPALGLCLFSLSAYNMVYDWRAWCSMIVLTALASAVVLVKGKEYKSQKSLVVFIPLCVFAYTFGAVSTTNCLFDYHTPKLYAVETHAKNSGAGSKTHNYTLEISGGPGGKEALKASVSKGVYHATKIGDPLRLYLYPGLWGIEWYTVMPWPRAAV